VASPVLASLLAAASAVLSVQPPAPRLLVTQEPETAAAGGYDEALVAIDEANTAVNRDPEANLATLEQAITRLLEFGVQVASDPKGREALDLSQLNLARALLMTEAKDRAAEVMDDVLRSAQDRKLPVKRFGPTLASFYDERQKLLDAQGTGSLQVHCFVACRVVIDEHAATTESGPLYLGKHRVWVEAADGSEPPLRTTVELTEAGVAQVLDYPAAAKDDCESPLPPTVVETPKPEPTTPKRILPRWAEITVLTLGVGAVAAGGVLLAMDGNCPGGGDPVADAGSCPEVFESTAAGLVSIGVGSAFLLAGTITLAIDEVRVGKQTGRQAMLTWQMRF
jgi:hypothetical protein